MKNTTRKYFVKNESDEIDELVAQLAKADARVHSIVNKLIRLDSSNMSGYASSQIRKSWEKLKDSNTTIEDWFTG